MGSTPTSVTDDRVVQRRRRLGDNQEIDGSIPGTDPKGWSGTTDYAQIRQPAERLGSDPRVCRFDSCSGYLKQYVLVEQRSARLPVTQEIVGSNPIGDARPKWRGTQTGKAAKLKPS